MEAGRTSTCLLVTYDSVKRLVEPYAMKFMQKRDGTEREYLYVYDRDGGRNSGPGSKTFIADKLTAVENTDQKFEPRWPIELSKSGEIPSNHLLFDPNKPMKRPTSRSTFGGLQYIYQCSLCGKSFKRSSMDSQLNPHKNKGGFRCPGTFGIYVGTT